jgi:hypothetical protein
MFPALLFQQMRINCLFAVCLHDIYKEGGCNKKQGTFSEAAQSMAAITPIFQDFQAAAPLAATVVVGGLSLLLVSYTIRGYISAHKKKGPSKLPPVPGT